MDERQTRQLLIRASAVDSRIVHGVQGDAAVTMWHELLGHVDFLELVSALDEHRLTAPGVYLEPGHLVQILTKRRTAGALKPSPAPECDLHDGYVLDAVTGMCAQCVRYPDDRQVGVKPATRHLGELTAGRTVQEA